MGVTTTASSGVTTVISSKKHLERSSLTPVWLPIQTFPAADGSRTLRTSIPSEAIDAIHCVEASGLRHTVFRNKHRKFLSKTEIRDGVSNSWMDLKQWQRELARRRALLSKRMPQKVPASVFEALKKGDVVGVTQRTVTDPDSPEGSSRQMRDVIEIELRGGVIVSLNEFLRREMVDVEMCLPLSREEAVAFFEEDAIMGVRHSFVVDIESERHEHVVEVTSVGEVWSKLPPNTVVAWDSIVEPHFRITFANKLNYNHSRQVVHSQTPWH